MKIKFVIANIKKKEVNQMTKSQNTVALVEVQVQDQQGLQTPDDLMSLKELCLKHSLEYDYLYKWSVVKGEIKVHFRGVWKVSESEVLDYINSKAEEKLRKLKSRKGGE